MIGTPESTTRALHDSVATSVTLAVTGAPVEAVQEACQHSVRALQQVLALHYQQHRARSSSQDGARGSTRRQGVLDTLMDRLDSAAAALHDTLDSLGDMPTLRVDSTPDPEQIIAYSHRLRYTTFAKMGTISLPPAPQQWQMAQSNLNRFSSQHAAHHARPPVPQAMSVPATDPSPAQPAPLAATRVVPAYQEGYTLQDGGALPTTLPEPAPRLPMLDQNAQLASLILNPDLEDASEYSSEEDEDEEDWA